MSNYLETPTPASPLKAPESFGGGIGITTVLPGPWAASAAFRRRSLSASTPQRSSSTSSFSLPSAPRSAAARSGTESLIRGGAAGSGLGRAQAGTSAAPAARSMRTRATGRFTTRTYAPPGGAATPTPRLYELQIYRLGRRAHISVLI